MLNESLMVYMVKQESKKPSYKAILSKQGPPLQRFGGTYIKKIKILRGTLKYSQINKGVPDIFGGTYNFNSGGRGCSYCIKNEVFSLTQPIFQFSIKPYIFRKFSSKQNCSQATPKTIKRDDRIKSDIQPRDSFCGPQQNLQILEATCFSRSRYFRIVDFKFLLENNRILT